MRRIARTPAGAILVVLTILTAISLILRYGQVEPIVVAGAPVVVIAAAIVMNGAAGRPVVPGVMGPPGRPAPLVP